jgi:hypothetical protein
MNAHNVASFGLASTVFPYNVAMNACNVAMYARNVAVHAYNATLHPYIATLRGLNLNDS